MRPFHYNPPEELSPYIAFYGIWDVDEGFRQSYVSPPLGFCGIIICLDDSINARLNGKLFMKGRYCATGQITAPMTGDVIGKNRIIMIFIHPCGLYQLFGHDMSLLTNTTMPLARFLGEDECRKLIKKLNKASGNDRIIEVLNDFFSSQLPAFDLAPKVKCALDYIHENNGNVSVRDIEVNCFITARSLERYFNLYIGLSPKEYAKIFRFKCLVNFINQTPGVTWAELCEQNGYYDQSHLSRYFSRYLKVKPGEVVNLDMDFIIYLLQ